jgi:uncharacterized protein with ParB-like and HNH nuclease domain
MKVLQSLSEIFHKRLFRIPDYQRGYAWVEQPHLQDFWEDLINLKDKRSHYTGVLSLKVIDTDIWSKNDQWVLDRWMIEERKYTPYHIVDGQQRLTTAVILLHCLIDLIKHLPENIGKTSEVITLGGYSLKSIEEQYLSVVQPGEGVIRTYIFGYEEGNPNSKYLRHKILNEPDGGVIEDTFYTQNLATAKDFFKRNIVQIYKDKAFGYKGIEVIFDALTNQLKFNLYEIGDDFDVFVAFETMNNRGKQLSNLEKLKNRLIYLTTLYGENEIKQNERQQVRMAINEAWKLVYHQLGRNKAFTLPDDEYLRAHWIAYFKYTKNKGDDYIKFLLNDKFTTHNVFEKKATLINAQPSNVIVFDEPDDDDVTIEPRNEEIAEPIVQASLQLSEINDYVKKLGASAIYWHATFFPYEHKEEDVSTAEKEWLDKLNRLGMGYFRPLVMAALSNRALSSEKRVELFKAIERFLFLTMRLGKQYANYRNSAYYNFARDLYHNASAADLTITGLQGDMWPIIEHRDGSSILKTADFKNFLLKKFDARNVEGYYAWSALRYFLFEYEIERKGSRGEKVTWKDFMNYEKDKVSIEHIYPQTPNLECWDQYFGKYDDYQRRCLSASLGNLLLLSRSINSRLQNDCYVDKISKKDANNVTTRSGYSEGSYSELEVVNQWPEWTAEAIRDRGLALLDFMAKRWEFEFSSEEEKRSLLHLDFLE